MAEVTSNVEFAQKIHEHGHGRGGPSSGAGAWFEIVEVALLAVVAVMTAWSSYQAARWDALSAKSYAVATRTTVMAQEKTTLVAHERLFDMLSAQAWGEAKLAGNTKMADFYQRRFRSEYRVAFDAWMAIGGIDNPKAPPGPIFMPEYKSALAEEAARLNHEAEAAFEAGVENRETGDSYVRVTVLLATVLLLTALAQRLSRPGPRLALLAVAFVLLAISSYSLLTFPRA